MIVQGTDIFCNIQFHHAQRIRWQWLFILFARPDKDSRFERSISILDGIELDSRSRQLTAMFLLGSRALCDSLFDGKPFCRLGLDWSLCRLMTLYLVGMRVLAKNLGYCSSSARFVTIYLYTHPRISCSLVRYWYMVWIRSQSFNMTMSSNDTSRSIFFCLVQANDLALESGSILLLSRFDRFFPIPWTRLILT